MIYRRVSVGIVSALVLASCTRSPETPNTAVHAAQSAVRTATYLLQGGGLIFRPSALLGTYVASYLAQGTSLAKSALKGVEQQIALFFEETSQKDESYQLLQDMGAALAVKIPDMLNRSPNRARDLDAYVSALRALQAASQRQNEALNSKKDTAQDILRERQRHLSDVKRELTKAIRDEDYVTAGSLQDAVNKAQTDVASADADLKEVRNILALYNDVLDLSEERITAIIANRDVLIAGVKVVDVPGIGDIGVVQGDPSRLRNNKGRSVFDGL